MKLAPIRRVLLAIALVQFATLVYLVLTEHSGEVRVLNGGHMPPVVVRAGVRDRCRHQQHAVYPPATTSAA